MIVIEAMIVGGLGSVFILVMNNSTSVKDSLDRTEDARLAASYIISDARNSSGPETSLSDTASCPDPSPPVSGTPTVGRALQLEQHQLRGRDHAEHRQLRARFERRSSGASAKPERS